MILLLFGNQIGTSSSKVSSQNLEQRSGNMIVGAVLYIIAANAAMAYVWWGVWEDLK